MCLRKYVSIKVKKLFLIYDLNALTPNAPPIKIESQAIMIMTPPIGVTMDNIGIPNPIDR